MGCPLFVDDTSGAADPRRPRSERFERIELDALQAFASLAAATVNVAERIERLAMRAEDEHQRAEIYRQASGQQHKEMIGQSKPHKRLVKGSTLGGSDLTC
jgi:anaerobic nitric oxide reductase transcription regulator